LPQVSGSRACAFEKRCRVWQALHLPYRSHRLFAGVRPGIDYS
jgi:hypothetical protein